ncbi:MAG TPA: glycosyltransferase, partial [Candidatus Krumholzibacteria bacterium]|nr:glycosyltransferase [Candidatus Krumholzibacteria bacterium]
MPKIVVLHLISPTGYYGAERWVVAQVRHLDPTRVEAHIAVTREGDDESPEILARARALGLSTHEITLAHRFDPRAASSVAKLACALDARVLHG